MQYGFNYFLFNMALSDFLITLLNCGSTWTYNFYFEWYYPSVFCTFNHFFGVAPSTSSLFSLIIISYDRCLAIVNPLSKNAISKKSAIFIISLIWIFSGIMSLPSIFGAKTSTIYVRSSASELYKKRKICKIEFAHKDL